MKKVFIKKGFMQRMCILLVAMGIAFSGVTEARGMSFLQRVWNQFVPSFLRSGESAQENNVSEFYQNNSQQDGNLEKPLVKNEIKIGKEVKIVADVKLEIKTPPSPPEPKYDVKVNLDQNGNFLVNKNLKNELPKKVNEKILDKNDVKKPLNGNEKSLNVKKSLIINKLPPKQKIIPVSGLTVEVRKLLQEFVNKGDPWGVLQLGLKCVNTLQDGRDWLKAFEAAAGNLYQKLGGQDINKNEKVNQNNQKNVNFNNNLQKSSNQILNLSNQSKLNLTNDDDWEVIDLKVSKNEKIENLNKFSNKPFVDNSLDNKSLNKNEKISNFDNKPFVDNNLKIDEKAQRKVMLGLVNNIAKALQKAGIGILKLEGGLIPAPKTKVADANLENEILSQSEFCVKFKKKNGAWPEVEDLPKGDALTSWFYNLTSYWWQTLENKNPSWEFAEYLAGNLYGMHLASKTRELTLQEKELTKNCAQKLISFYYHLLQSNHPGNAKDLNGSPLGNAASFLGPLLYWTEQLLLDKNVSLNEEQRKEILGAIVNLRAVKGKYVTGTLNDYCDHYAKLSGYLMKGLLHSSIGNQASEAIIYAFEREFLLLYFGKAVNFEYEEAALLKCAELAVEMKYGMWTTFVFLGEFYEKKSTIADLEIALKFYETADKVAVKEIAEIARGDEFLIQRKQDLKSSVKRVTKILKEHFEEHLCDNVVEEDIEENE